MPPTETHCCCVYANETENRCAACSAVGTDLFFFQEHQKLIWKVHKRFCGKASFEHPLLKLEEAEHAKRIALTPVLSTGKTLTAMLTRRDAQNSHVEALAKSHIDDMTVNSVYAATSSLNYSQPGREFCQATASCIPPYLVLLELVKRRIEPVEGEVVAAAIRAEVDTLLKLWGDAGLVARLVAELGMEDCL
ncbi:hypothetical protein JCM10207_000183 [Rhodosporidiobolus poonsookiae]